MNIWKYIQPHSYEDKCKLKLTEILYLTHQIGKNSKAWQYTLFPWLWKDRHSHTLLAGMQNGRNAKPLLKGIWHQLIKLLRHLSFNIAIPFLGICPGDIPHSSTKIHMCKATNYSIIFRKLSKCLSTGDWLNIWPLYSVEYYPSVNKEWGRSL